ncbi:hypothetical protein ABEB36_003227 [Hypothenemus hampei]|uniref:3'-5' exonuclease n=1 Tax=Hypothenemus hampei TaxID=57062 RepID=A0ABD1F8H0_HYPHA
MNSSMRLRSSVSAEDRELEKLKKQQEIEEKLNRPYINYTGQIRYCNDLIDCAIACDELLLMVNESYDDEFVIGFDMEWPFNFKTGSGKTALIQISPNLKICYLLHIPLLKRLPKGLYELLHNPKIRVTGVNIKNDVRKLARDYPGFNVDQLLNSCLDTGDLANRVLPCTQRWSMEKLIDYVLKMKINKSNKVRMSKWNVVPLSQNQIIYAAIDAYASLLLYKELKKLELQSAC